MDNDPEPVQEQKKEKPLNELLTSTIVDIYVGEESSHWPLHERLICYHSPFLANIFYKEADKAFEDNKNKTNSRKSYGFPDEDDHTFTLLVGWLYSRSVPTPKSEKDIGPLLDLYLLSEKLQIDRLSTDVVDAVREFYHTSSSYPGLRRVQYIYANTDEDNEMREMMVSCVARQLTTTEKIPMHWANALQRNGQLAVDIIRSIQRWNIEERSIPDVRDSSVSSRRGRKNKSGFSAILREGESMETETTAVSGSVSLGSNLGVESVNSEEPFHSEDKYSHMADSGIRSISEVGREGRVEANHLAVSSLSLLQAQLHRPPDDFLSCLDDDSRMENRGWGWWQLQDQARSQEELRRRKNKTRRTSVTFKPECEILGLPSLQDLKCEGKDEAESDNADQNKSKFDDEHAQTIHRRKNVSREAKNYEREGVNGVSGRPTNTSTTNLDSDPSSDELSPSSSSSSPLTSTLRFISRRQEPLFLLILWVMYLYWVFGSVGTHLVQQQQQQRHTYSRLVVE